MKSSNNCWKQILCPVGQDTEGKRKIRMTCKAQMMLSYPSAFLMCLYFLLYCMNFTHHVLCKFFTYLSSSLDSMFWGGRDYVCQMLTKIFQWYDMYYHAMHIDSCQYVDSHPVILFCYFIIWCSDFQCEKHELQNV